MVTSIIVRVGVFVGRSSILIGKVPFGFPFQSAAIQIAVSGSMARGKGKINDVDTFRVKFVVKRKIAMFGKFPPRTAGFGGARREPPVPRSGAENPSRVAPK